MRMALVNPLAAWQSLTMSAATEIRLVVRRHVDFLRVNSDMCRRAI
jgi:hypothetical protein